MSHGFLKDEWGRFFKPVLTKVEFSSSPNYLLYVFPTKKLYKYFYNEEYV